MTDVDDQVRIRWRLEVATIWATIATLAVIGLADRVRRTPKPINRPGDRVTIAGREYVLTTIRRELNGLGTAEFTAEFEEVDRRD